MGGGLALATTTNIYKFIGTPYAGVTDYTETGKGQGLMLQTSVGYEFMFADHVTLDVRSRLPLLQSHFVDVSECADGQSTARSPRAERSRTTTVRIAVSISADSFGGAGFRFFF